MVALMDHGTYEDWVEVYEDIYVSPGSIGAKPCPSCGFLDLRLVVVLPSAEAYQGSAAFWCQHCLHGIQLDHAGVHAGIASIVRSEQSRDASVIPDYRLVPPSAWGGGEERVY